MPVRLNKKTRLSRKRVDNFDSYGLQAIHKSLRSSATRIAAVREVTSSLL